jgi:signal transduction histidine kinase/ActR/RegA family two-component response regulator
LGDVVISEDLGRETRFRPTPALLEQGINSKITVPVYDDVLYGVLTACSPHKEKFNANEINFMRAVANVLSSACARRESEAKILQLNLNLQSANDELRANETRLLQGNQISTDLMSLRVRTRDELQSALHQITESTSAMLCVERSSVWLFNEDRTRLRCLDLFQRDTQQHSNDLELLEDENYFPAIKSQRVFVADDARNHPATRGFSETYFEPNGIVSMLDIALVVGGKHIGVLCSEQVGEMRQWQAEDRTFASAIASVCSLVLESYERARAEIALHEAKEQAELATESANAANLAKSEFLSRMSHELRTPLNAILGFGQILEMHIEAPKQLANIQQILKAGRHLLGLINEVLDIARIEAGGLSLSLEPINVGLVVKESLDLVRPLAVAKEIQLTNNIADHMAEKHLLADQQRFKQVLLNLLSNAVKYGGQDGEVFVECELSTANQQPFLRVSVRDTGAGISAEDIARLFVPFERLGAASTQIEGTGIGLTLCKHLVEAMNGRIGVASELARGSTFWVEMPLVESPIEQAVQGDALQTAQLPEVLETVLYIEDNLSNITLIEQVLADGNYHVRLLTAMQGSVGLELAIQHLPDLILLDVHLPDIMGDIVLRRLKENAATRDIPVVVLSADATQSQVERLLSDGAKAYLTKPLDLKQFFSVLESVLGQTS